MAAKKRAPAPATPKPTLGVVADVHAHSFARYGGEMVDGLNLRGRETVGAFRAAILAAEAAGCTTFMVAGDLTHVRRPDPALLAALQDALEEAPDMEKIIVPGNHDCLDATAEGGNTSCAPLQGYAQIVERPTWFTLSGALVALAVPFDGRKPMADHIASVLPEMEKERPAGADSYVLVTHVGVYDEEDAPPWMRKARDAIESKRFQDLLATHGFGQAFVGNYHNQAVWYGDSTPKDPTICQVGTLCPATFSDPAIGVGGMALVRPQGMEMVTIPGPRFETLESADLKRRVQDLAPGCSYYLRVRGPNQPDPKLQKKGVRVLEWLPDAKRGDAQAGTVPGVTLTPEEALHQAVEEAEPELRADVEDLLKRAWAAGAA